MRTIYCLLLLLCPYFGMAQPPVLDSISPGDKVPDIAFNNMLNYKSSIAKLADFKGKLVLLDFWATWCGNCIKKFNLLDSMQRTYAGKLAVILVNTADTRDTKERIERFLNRQKNSAGKKFTMPVVYNDTTAGRLFPHDAIPHYVWLNEQQRVIGITGAGPVTAANIQKLLKGQAVNLAAEEGGSYNFDEPLLAGAGMQDSTAYRSALLPFMPGIKTGSRFIEDSITCRYSFINMPLRQLLRTAWSLAFQKDRLLLEVPDSMLAKLQTQPVDESGFFCYEMVAPRMPLKSLLLYMRQDMQRYFNLAVKTAILPADCYVMTADNSLLARYKTTGGKPINKLAGRDKRYMVNQPLATLADYLDKTLDRKVILQPGTGFNLDLELPDFAAANIGGLQKQLAAMGILLTPSCRLIEQKIIYQTPKPKLP